MKNEDILCKSEEELIDCLIMDKDTISLEHNFAKKIVNIKNIGKLAWGILISGVLVAATSIISSKSFNGKNKILINSIIATVPSISIAIFYIGIPSTISLVQLIIYACQKSDKNINNALNIVLKLRSNYYLSEKNKEKYILKKVAKKD